MLPALTVTTVFPTRRPDTPPLMFTVAISRFSELHCSAKPAAFAGTGLTVNFFISPTSTATDSGDTTMSCSGTTGLYTVTGIRLSSAGYP